MLGKVNVWLRLVKINSRIYFTPLFDWLIDSRQKCKSCQISCQYVRPWAISIYCIWISCSLKDILKVFLLSDRWLEDLEGTQGCIVSDSYQIIKCRATALIEEEDTALKVILVPKGVIHIIYWYWNNLLVLALALAVFKLFHQ